MGDDLIMNQRVKWVKALLFFLPFLCQQKREREGNKRQQEKTRRKTCYINAKEKVSKRSRRSRRESKRESKRERRSMIVESY